MIAEVISIGDELVSGQMQMGDARFETRAPAVVDQHHVGGTIADGHRARLAFATNSSNA